MLMVCPLQPKHTSTAAFVHHSSLEVHTPLIQSALERTDPGTQSVLGHADCRRSVNYIGRGQSYLHNLGNPVQHKYVGSLVQAAVKK